MQVSGETRTWPSQGPLKLILGNPSFPWVGAVSACLLPAPTPFRKPRGLTRAASPRHRPGLHLPNCPSPTDLPPPVTTRHTRAHIVLPLSFEPLRTALMPFLGHSPWARSSVGTLHTLFRLSLLMTSQGIVYCLNGHTNSCRVIRSYCSGPKASRLVLDF